MCRTSDDQGLIRLRPAALQFNIYNEMAYPKHSAFVHGHFLTALPANLLHFLPLRLIPEFCKQFAA
jgi:hypothetical protein